MILDLVYIDRGLYTSNQIWFKAIYLLDLRATDLYTKSLYYLVNVLIFIKSFIKVVVLIKLMSTQEKIFSYI